jgi:4-amino-4-deoxy-L-arabinose transferase-like glycosyltransferase
VKPALAILVGAAMLRLLLAIAVPLVPDEAYYWEWSRHLAAGYFDHPPAIAWLVRAGTMVAGDTPLGVRLVTIVLGFVGCAAAVDLAHRLGGARSAFRAAVFLSVVPLAGIGLVLATPDVPLLACSAIALWALDHALATGGGPPTGPNWFVSVARGPLGWWTFVGIATGMALLSKYTAVLIPAGAAVACLVSARLRPHLTRPGPYLACGIAVLMFLPVVQWNGHHDWVSFAFQFRHGLGPPKGSAIGRELELVGVQLGLVTPILFPLLVVAVATTLAQPSAGRPFVLACVSGFVWGFFTISALRRPVSPNWPALAMFHAIVLLALQPWRRRRAGWEGAGVALAAVLVVAVSVHAVHPWFPLQPRRDPIAQAYGWDDLARAVDVDDRQLTAPGVRVWIAADRYQEAAELALHLPAHPTVFSLELASRPSQFDLWPTARDSVRLGEGMTLVLDDSDDQPLPVTRLAPYFAQVVRGARVEMHWGAGRVVARRRIWHFVQLTIPLSTLLVRAPS